MHVRYIHFCIKLLCNTTGKGQKFASEYGAAFCAYQNVAQTGECIFPPAPPDPNVETDAFQDNTLQVDSQNSLAPTLGSGGAGGKIHFPACATVSVRTKRCTVFTCKLLSLTCPNLQTFVLESVHSNIKIGGVFVCVCHCVCASRTDGTRHDGTRDMNRRDVTRHDTTRHETTRRDATRRTRNDTTRHDTTRRTRNVTTRHDATRHVQERRDRRDTTRRTRHDATTDDDGRTTTTTRHDATRHDAMRHDTTRRTRHD